MSKALKPVHPGEILREEFLKPLGLSMNALALDLHVPVTRVAEVVHERRAITPDTALRLARYFNTTPEFWMNLQVAFDLETARDREQAKVDREVRPKAATVALSEA
jgi:addiction module HigA family antidote